MTIQIRELSELLGHDRDQVRLVARALYRCAAMDLQRLRYAAAANEWGTVSELAERIQMDCLQLSENTAAEAVAELGRVPGRWFADAYARHQSVITELLSHTEDFAR
jgi:hypothetical protein